MELLNNNNKKNPMFCTQIIAVSPRNVFLLSGYIVSFGLGENALKNRMQNIIALPRSRATYKSRQDTQLIPLRAANSRPSAINGVQPCFVLVSSYQQLMWLCQVGRIGERSPKWRWLKDKEGKSPRKQNKRRSEDRSEDLR